MILMHLVHPSFVTHVLGGVIGETRLISECFGTFSALPSVMAGVSQFMPILGGDFEEGL